MRKLIGTLSVLFWTVFSLAQSSGGNHSGGTGAGFTPPVTATQSANNANLEKFKRFTDSAPTGFFELFRDNADTTTLWSVDVLGAATATSYATTGTNAGADDLPQGADPGNGTNSFRWMAPTSIPTSYRETVPTAAATNNNSAMTCSNATPGVCTWSKMPQLAITTTSYTNATTTFSNVTGTNTLQFSVEASTNYMISCDIHWQGSAGTTGPKFQFTGPASPTAVAAYAHHPITTSTYIDAPATAFSTSMPNTGTITTATNFVSHITLGLVNGVNAGTVVLQAGANGAGTLTINAGSTCQMW